MRWIIRSIGNAVNAIINVILGFLLVLSLVLVVGGLGMILSVFVILFSIPLSMLLMALAYLEYEEELLGGDEGEN